MTTASSAGSRTQSAQRSWALSRIPFFCKGLVGHMVCDTGAEVSIVTRSFAVAAGLTLIQRAAPRFVRTPAGRHASTATTTLPLTIQLMLDCGGALVHWDRSITLCDVWVVDSAAHPLVISMSATATGIRRYSQTARTRLSGNSPTPYFRASRCSTHAVFHRRALFPSRSRSFTRGITHMCPASTAL